MFKLFSSDSVVNGNVRAVASHLLFASSPLMLQRKVMKFTIDKSKGKEEKEKEKGKELEREKEREKFKAKKKGSIIAIGEKERAKEERKRGKEKEKEEKEREREEKEKEEEERRKSNIEKERLKEKEKEREKEREREKEKEKEKEKKGKASKKDKKEMEKERDRGKERGKEKEIEKEQESCIDAMSVDYDDEFRENGAKVVLYEPFFFSLSFLPHFIIILLNFISYLPSNILPPFLPLRIITLSKFFYSKDDGWRDSRRSSKRHSLPYSALREESESAQLSVSLPDNAMEGKRYIIIFLLIFVLNILFSRSRQRVLDESHRQSADGLKEDDSGVGYMLTYDAAQQEVDSLYYNRMCRV